MPTGTESQPAATVSGSSGRPPVTIVHDYLTQRGGAERVVLAMARTFPEAPIYTCLLYTSPSPRDS